MFLLTDAEVEEEGEEAKWQDRISSGFDRLVAFASTELDKRRRSTEGGDSCNTSPDSGIGHGEMTPVQLTLPLVKRTEAIKLKASQKPTMFKAPVLKSANVDSPPIAEPQPDEVGPPRTPSPSASPNLPVTYNQSTTDNIESAAHQSVQSEKPVPHINPTLFKYQRQEIEKKHMRPDHHFKKKFYYREQWRTSDTWDRAQNDHASEQDQLDTATSAVSYKTGATAGCKFTLPAAVAPVPAPLVSAHAPTGTDSEWVWNKEARTYNTADYSDAQSHWNQTSLTDRYTVASAWKN